MVLVNNIFFYQDIKSFSKMFDHIQDFLIVISRYTTFQTNSWNIIKARDDEGK